MLINVMLMKKHVLKLTIAPLFHKSQLNIHGT